MKKLLYSIMIFIGVLFLFSVAMAGPPAGSVTSILVDHDGDYGKITRYGGIYSVGVDYPHYQIHAGNHYYAFYNAVLASTESFQLLINTPAEADGVVHLTIPARGSGEGYITFHEFPTVSALGVVVDVFNRNLRSSNISNTVVSLDPTITALGNRILEEHFGAGHNQGGETRFNREHILKSSTLYLINCISEAAGNHMDIQPDFYEDPGNIF